MKVPKIKPVFCPFCGRPVKKPEFLPFGLSDFEAGRCECGSVYVCDVTGHNRGAAFVEALFLACGGDWDIAWDLTPEEDYKEVWIENYDITKHAIIEDETSKRNAPPVLCFLKLSKDIQDLKESRVKEIFSKKENTSIKPIKKRLTRKEISELVEKEDIKSLIAYHMGEPLNLNTFQKLLYHPDPTFRKKAAVFLGKVVSEMMNVYPQKIIDLIRRLIYASADSAASAWGALEAVGEIIRNTGENYSIFIKNLFSFLRYPEYRPFVLSALYRISEKHPELFKNLPYLSLLDLFNKESLENQALILLIFKNLKKREILPYIQKLSEKEDLKEISLYDYQTFQFKKVPFNLIVKEVFQELKT